MQPKTISAKGRELLLILFIQKDAVSATATDPAIVKTASQRQGNCASCKGRKALHIGQLSGVAMNIEKKARKRILIPPVLISALASLLQRATAGANIAKVEMATMF